MEKIKSFTIDHMTLLPGVYESRCDILRGQKESFPVTTYDIRITRPNFEPVMSTAEIHAIEHLGATYLRNRSDISARVVYWGPMGCRTGFYLILAGEADVSLVKALMADTFSFIADYEGDIPGATPTECGNYSDMDLPAAKDRAGRSLGILKM